MSHDDFAPEPPRGLPDKLPPGEALLWQGTPDWRSLAWRGYQIRSVLVYIGVLVLASVAFGIAEHRTGLAIASSCAIEAVLGAVAIGLLALLAWSNARSTVYTITSRRLVWRHGVAVPMTMNVPFRCIESADLRVYGDGTGDIAVALPNKERIGYLVNWPHLRPGRIAHPQPSFRALKDAKTAAQILGQALSAA